MLPIVDVMVDEKQLTRVRGQRNRARLLLVLSLIVNFFLIMGLIQQERQLSGVHSMVLQLTIELDKLTEGK